jgi:hypothetical protein
MRATSVTQVTERGARLAYGWGYRGSLPSPPTLETTMKKTLLALALIGTATLASAQSWRMLPVLNDPGFQFKPTLALSAGTVNPKDARDASTWGLDLSFNCGLFQSPDNRIRTHFQISRSNKDDLKATAFELSPRYTVPLGSGFSVGAGPSLTAVRLSAPGLSETVYGAGLAAGLDWHAGNLYAGADLRWHDTGARHGVQYDSTALGLKVGVNF